MQITQNDSVNQMQIIIAGAAGIVGRELTKHIAKRSDMNIVGAISSPNSKYHNRDVGEVAGIAPIKVKISNNIDEVFSNLSNNNNLSLIDFSLPEAAIAIAPAIAEFGSVYVVGTTAHTEETQKAINMAATKIPVIQSSNMSFALIVLAELAQKAAQLLNKTDWDINITDRHRKGKKDGISGTAKMLEDMMLNNDEREIEIISSRRKNLICEHDIYFEGDKERIILSHHVQSREVFAEGSAKACLWGMNRKPALYNMRDVIGLNKTK